MKYVVILILFTVSLFSQQHPPKREFRGVWLATVVNIDWPVSSSVSSGEKILELVKIFDKLDSAGINAVFFQVRTECDALYNSSIEPWSYWLTGEQGSTPNPYFDPLAFAISEAHNRGMELHAWLNPYRAVRKIGDYKISPNHISITHPDWILNFDDYKMLNPGIPEVKKYIVNVVMDIVNKYDVDGIHFDDYFYPYTPHISNEDSDTFKKYGAGFSNIDDWRRYNINSLMKMVYQNIKSGKPEIKFGISPFGIVENRYAGTKGFESYHRIYCDPVNWLDEKIVDYITPQVYWPVDSKNAGYGKLVKWWSKITYPAQLYIGQFSSKFSATDYKNFKTETLEQLKLNRNTTNVSGEVFFSAKSIFLNYGGLFDSLKNNYYKFPALIPVVTEIDSIPPFPPFNMQIIDSNDTKIITWENPSPAEDGDIPSYYIVYGFNANEIPDTGNPAKILKILRKKIENQYIIDKKKEISSVVITSLDRMRNESRDNPFIVIK